MHMLKIIGAGVLLFASPAIAKDKASARWTVTQASGDVRVVRNGLQPASLQVRASLAPGDVVATGATGRVVLVRGGDYVVVAPGSRLLLPKEETSGFTRLLQQVGTMLYKVQHTGVPHFEVKTPLLAAVVKGTSFTVVVDDKRAAVQVTDGLVEVSSADGAARQLVEKGVTVYVGHDSPGAIVTVGPKTQIEAAPSADSVKVETSGEVTVAAIADLSEGLVTAKLAAPTVASDTKPTAGGLTVATVNVAQDGDTKSGRLVAPLTGIADSFASGDTTKSDPIVTSPVLTSLDQVVAPVIDVKQIEPVVIEPVITVFVEPVVTVIKANPVITQPVVVTNPIINTVITQPVITSNPLISPLIKQPIKIGL